MKRLILFCAVLFVSLPAVAQQKESAYDRVMRTHTMRCGYFIEPPFTIRDENTGHMRGIAVDLAEAIAKELDIKIVWSEQISFGTFPQDLQSGRYDAVCGSVFTLPRAGVIDYMTPYAFVPVYGYTKPANQTFDKPFAAIDWSKVTIAGLDGEGATMAARKMLPQAKFTILPQLSNISEMLMLTGTGKADIAFVLPSVFADFDKTNPGVLRRANLDRPLYVYAVAFGIPRGQMEFKSMLDNTMTQLTASGELAAIHKKYDPTGVFRQPTYFPGK
jgi:ABC-type amino acid transport substrate-binding protein